MADKEKRPIVYWDKESEERLTHKDQDEAIEYVLDEMTALPETLEICGYAKMALPTPENLGDDVLSQLLERLDEDYSDPARSYSDATDAMKESAETFAKTVLDEYESWACEVVKRETIDVMKWVKTHRPDWLVNS
jgi:hypothetical protein